MFFTQKYISLTYVLWINYSLYLNNEVFFVLFDAVIYFKNFYVVTFAIRIFILIVFKILMYNNFNNNMKYLAFNNLIDRKHAYIYIYIYI